jgi:hypothetical protein
VSGIGCAGSRAGSPGVAGPRYVVPQRAAGDEAAGAEQGVVDGEQNASGGPVATGDDVSKQSIAKKPRQRRGDRRPDT